MKKLLIGLLSIIAITSFAAVNNGWPTDFDWNSQDVTKIDNWIKYQQEAGHKSRLILALSIKDLVGKSSETITYAEFKEIILKNTQTVTKNAKNTKNMFTSRAAMIARGVVRFQDFLPMIIVDPDFEKSSYVMTNLITRPIRTTSMSGKFDGTYLLDAVSWRKVTFEKYIYIFQNDPVILKTVIDRYEKEQLKFTKEQIKSDMELMKRVVYPKLDKNEKLKPIAVKIELILKSIQ